MRVRVGLKSSLTNDWGGERIRKLVSSYDDVISTVEEFFDQRDPSNTSPMKEVCGLQRGGLCRKINLTE